LRTISREPGTCEYRLFKALSTPASRLLRFELVALTLSAARLPFVVVQAEASRETQVSAAAKG
jgi:hypothetical protein